MEHPDHVELLRRGIPGPGGVWADLGSGTGAFTLALAELVGTKAEIYSIDRNRAALQEQKAKLQKWFPDRAVHFIAADFTQALDLPMLDGIIMANSLHYIRNKESLVRRLKTMLLPAGRLLLVEYNVDRGNLWVPYPLSYPSWLSLALRCGFVETRLLATRPSRFLGEIYSAVSKL
jgi:ubiquinone/menaquinone biosynthesis C-methylase UbiE